MKSEKAKYGGKFFRKSHRLKEVVPNDHARVYGAGGAGGEKLE